MGLQSRGPGLKRGNNFVSDFNREDEMKLKPGMFVSCIFRGQRVSKAYLGRGKSGSLVLYNDAYGWSNNGMEAPGYRYGEAPGYRYGWYFPPADPGNERITDIRVLDRKLEDGLEVGDVIGVVNGAVLKILAVIGDVVLTSLYGHPDRAGSWRTLSELKDGGYMLTPGLSPEIEGVTEITTDQIAEKFGLKPEQVRIKKAE